MIELILVDTNPALCEQFRLKFDGFRVVHGDFRNVDEWDCVISPGNSYGIMDGGFDAQMLKYFGPLLQTRVQAEIFCYHSGIQPVGASCLVETGFDQHPFIAYSPTMRYPMPISGTLNVYMAMKAALETIQAHNDNGGGEKRRFIEKVICPGLGTAAGKVSLEAAARQMRLAWDHVNKPPNRMSWEEVRRIELEFGGVL